MVLSFQYSQLSDTLHFDIRIRNPSSMHVPTAWSAAFNSTG